MELLIFLAVVFFGFAIWIEWARKRQNRPQKH